MANIELSEERINEMFENGEALTWARKVVGKQELSEEEKEFSEKVDATVQRFWKFNGDAEKTAIAELVGRIVEPEVFTVPMEILTSIFNDLGQYGEFDLVKIRKSPKNTLIARHNANRTGNVQKSYLDPTVGNTYEDSLQIETEIPMSNLRRDGALGVAEMALYAIEEFNRTRFNLILNFVDSLITNGGDNYSSGAITANAVKDITGYIDDNCFTGKPEIVALSNRLREACDAIDEKYYSNEMKNQFNALASFQEVRGCTLVPVKAGKKTGKGDTLLPKDRIFGFSGVLGDMYTKGEMRTLMNTDINSEIINLKFTGVEFGVCVTDTSKIYKFVIQ